ncbi:DUF6320 domain-containing protein [Marinilactibacillus sp. Marseille-P9653]|uniref:DUF6320 domain-containing protein n=1 Tax=Marinilactibacillus sp. Marseille-P9653 TaxID=2866583 RepID=UPI001CE43B50|nr:DUF6320 domain-containing protein [Marinilactibacillus sp. Marseille-P9653]
MNPCPHCKTIVKGEWSECPLCGKQIVKLEQAEVASDPFPAIPLRFNRARITKLLTLISVVAIVIYFLVQWLWSFEFFGLDYVVFGIMSMWMVVLIIIRKRRNITKGILYLILLLSGISLYFDFINDWSGWSITYSIPIICIFALVAMFLAIQMVRLDTEEYVLYLQAAALLGFIPLIFLLLGWTTQPLPSLISFMISTMMFWSVIILQGKEIRRTLRKIVDV